MDSSSPLKWNESKGHAITQNPAAYWQMSMMNFLNYY